MKTLIALSFVVLSIGFSFAQTPQIQQKYTHYDTLRGSITKERIWWDLIKYELYVTVNPEKQFIKGSNKIQYRVLEKYAVLQIDLQSPMKIEHAYQDGKQLEIRHDSSAHFITLAKNQNPGDVNEVIIIFSGKPKAAVKAPWDGGFTWAKDSTGKDFIATSCEGIGASIWWPCKDHMYDEPDKGMIIQANVPKNLMAVANGRLVKSKKEKDETKTYTWAVVNPINNYGVNINIGDYVHFSEKYKGEKGVLDMDYWVLRYNLAKAKAQFKDAPKMMKAFEYWFGPYPFYEDSYKLVEVPYLGMEHQSSVTYGNGYKNGYNGQDYSNTGWGDKFDFIIIHESGHEWFANNITNKNIADLWIHESFTAYSEALFVDYHYGKNAGAEYVRGIRDKIENKAPIIGDYDVSAEGSSDMYEKGSNMLHTLRQVVNDDEKWRDMLRGLNSTFYHQTVTTKQIEIYMAQALGLALEPFFDQYLRDFRVPVFEYRINKGVLNYKWSNCRDDFDMPLKVYSNGMAKLLYPTTTLKHEKLETQETSIKIDPDFYVYGANLMGN